MNIYEYYSIIDKHNYHDNSQIDEFISNNDIKNIIIKQIDTNILYIKENLIDNYHSMIIHKENNKFKFDLFKTTIRNDDSVVTMKINTYDYNENTLNYLGKIFSVKCCLICSLFLFLNLF